MLLRSRLISKCASETNLYEYKKLQQEHPDASEVKLDEDKKRLLATVIYDLGLPSRLVEAFMNNDVMIIYDAVMHEKAWLESLYNIGPKGRTLFLKYLSDHQLTMRYLVRFDEESGDFLTLNI